jgi:hypothetical protein
MFICIDWKEKWIPPKLVYPIGINWSTTMNDVRINMKILEMCKIIEVVTMIFISRIKVEVSFSYAF